MLINLCLSQKSYPLFRSFFIFLLIENLLGYSKILEKSYASMDGRVGWL